MEPGAEEATDRQIVWVLHMHPGLTRRQAHGIVAVDFENGVARCLCGVELRPDEIGDVPSGGCQVCECCIAKIR
ncbi:hypothetical protein [Saccharopolyspora elongata]|uniref:Uncharacterized protein n=1 Tax=Saccharopolyspora elongata TaxID=2530387 RepID=A0A4R4YBY4_9PSEU|nr:hypothetical protein [Saccharopolyspora elongata]TDD41364.1 hypothetical protein E1288_32825 [Saccharopolyspora elongata]